MAGQPKLKAQELVERVSGLIERGEWDDFTLAALKKEPHALIPSDPLHAYDVLGMIAALEQNIDDVRKNFELASKIGPNDPLVAGHYFLALNSLGYFSESLEQAEHLLHQSPDDRTELQNLFRGLWKAGYIRGARKIADRLEKLKQEIPSGWVEELKEAEAFLKERELKDQDVEKLVDLSVSVLRDKKVYYSTSSPKVLEDEDSQWLSFLFEVKRPVSEIVELNYEASYRLAASDIPDEVSDAVIVSFTSSIPS